MAILIILLMDILYDSQLGSRPLDDGDTTAAIKNDVYLQTIVPPSHTAQNFLNFMQFMEHFSKSYVGALRRIVAPPMGNPGSAPIGTTISKRGEK